MSDDVQHPAGAAAPTMATRLAACERELGRAAADAEALLARSAAQLGECQRLATLVRQHEDATRSLQATARAAQIEVARLADLVAERERQTAALETRISGHEAEYRRLTRLLADRAREIFELRLALGARAASNTTAEGHA